MLQYDKENEKPRMGWNGKCDSCGVQIEGNPDTDLHYDMSGYPILAYCDKCWNYKEKEEESVFLAVMVLWIVFFVGIIILNMVLK